MTAGTDAHASGARAVDAHETRLLYLLRGLRVYDDRRSSGDHAVSAGVVTVGAGVTTGEALDAMLPYGVTLPTGTHRDVCMAGLTLGGGYGLLARALGLLCDSLVSITWVRVPFPRYAHTLHFCAHLLHHCF